MYAQTQERAPVHPAAMSARGPRAVVIGGGFGGMASALRLRALGHRVTLVERQDSLGGRARVFRRGGFVFDAGPTVITAPYLFEELFELFGRRLDEVVRMVPVAPWYRMVFDDGSHFDYGPSLDATLREIERFAPGEEKGYLALLRHAGRLYERGFEGLGDQPFDSWRSMLRASPDLLRLRADRSVSRLVARHLRDPRLRRAFSLHPLLVGGNPFTTTSIYSLIHTIEQRWGVQFPIGGTGALVSALEDLMRDVGIELRLGSTVERIEIDAGRVTGVGLEGGAFLPAERVISNGDPPYVYRHLLAPRWRGRWSDRKLDRLRFSMGLFVVYFGTRRRYPDVAHHTILFGPRFRSLLEDIFEHGRLAPDMSLYLHRPTATDPGLAPEGHDGFYVLVPVPNLRHGIDWLRQGPALRDRVLDQLEARILPGLREALVEELFITPTYFRDQLLSLHGTGFSVQPLLRQSAYFRFHNRPRHVSGLYFVGAGTHPGAGVPGVLTSAKVVERLIRGEGAGGSA